MNPQKPLILLYLLSTSIIQQPKWNSLKLQNIRTTLEQNIIAATFWKKNWYFSSSAAKSEEWDVNMLWANLPSWASSYEQFLIEIVDGLSYFNKFSGWWMIPAIDSYKEKLDGTFFEVVRPNFWSQSAPTSVCCHFSNLKFVNV